MTMNIGFVGLSAKSGWAKSAILPGVRSIKNSPFKITGVLNSSLENAKASIETNKLEEDVKPYASIDDLVQAQDVDIVAVSVKGPDHYALVKKALGAGKDVICEWPLGNGLAEAEEMVKLALEKGVKTGISLQARKAPSVIKAKELIASGAIGKVISTNFKGSSDYWGQYHWEGMTMDYAFEKKNGASFFTATCGHNLDIIAFVLGEFEWLNGCLSRQFPGVEYIRPAATILDNQKKQERTGKFLAKDIDDQVLVQGQLLSGAVASIHIWGRQNSSITPIDELLRWEIHGTKGDIVMTGFTAVAGVVQLSIKMSQLDDDGNSKGLVDLTEPYNALTGNYQRFYESFAEKKTGAYVAPQLQQSEGFPTFEDALIRHQQIQAIQESSDTGLRKSYM